MKSENISSSGSFSEVGGLHPETVCSLHQGRQNSGTYVSVWFLDTLSQQIQNAANEVPKSAKKL